jgi:hypothetical protein
MKCVCGKNMECTDSRAVDSGRRRRYKCRCGERITTLEMIVDGTNRKTPVGETLKENLYAEFKAKAYDEIYTDIAVRLKEMIMNPQDSVS